MGRVKLKIKKLENTNSRQTTFAKRKNGILKKANELSILCDIDIVLLMFSPSGRPSLCCGRRSSIEEVIGKFAQVTPQERTKRKFESLEVLKKTFQKLDHNVNIRQFIASSNSTIEDLTTQATILQARISEIHGRLSYWTEPDKINNVEHLGQLEMSIRQSLDQLRAHKEQLGQQQQAMQIENANFVKDWSTCSMQDGMQIPLEEQLQSMSWILNNNSTNNIITEEHNSIPQREVECSASSSFGSYPGYFGTGKSPLEEQLQSMSWILNNNSTNNIITEEHNSIPQREVECSASSSFGSYPGYFGTGKSPEITISGQEASFLDELNNGQLKPQANSQQQFTTYNPNSLPPHAPPVYSFPMNQREYHMTGFFEAPPPGSSAYNNNNNTNQARFGSSSSSMPCSVSMFDDFFFSQMQQPN